MFLWMVIIAASQCGCVSLLLNCSRKYILSRDRPLAAGSEARPGGSVTSPGSQALSAFQLTMHPRKLLSLFDLETIAASLDAVSTYWTGKAKPHLLAKLFSFTKGNPGDCLLTVLAPELGHVTSQHRAWGNWQVHCVKCNTAQSGKLRVYGWPHFQCLFPKQSSIAHSLFTKCCFFLAIRIKASSGGVCECPWFL